jgi:hypothetical protein
MLRAALAKHALVLHTLLQGLVLHTIAGQAAQTDRLEYGRQWSIFGQYRGCGLTPSVKDVAALSAVCHSTRAHLHTTALKAHAEALLADIFSDPHSSMRTRAVDRLGTLGQQIAAPHAAAVADLLSLHGLGRRRRNDEYDLKGAALDFLGQLGKYAVPHVGAIVAQLRDNTLRPLAREALQRLGDHVVPAAAALAALLADSDASVRGAALDVLGKLGEHATEHAATMAAVMGDAHASVRKMAMATMDRLGLHALPAMAAMVAYLRHQDVAVRSTAVKVLGKLGQHAAPHAAAIAALTCANGSQVPCLEHLAQPWAACSPPCCPRHGRMAVAQAQGRPSRSR